VSNRKLPKRRRQRKEIIAKVETTSGLESEFEKTCAKTQKTREKSCFLDFEKNVKTYIQFHRPLSLSLQHSITERKSVPVSHRHHAYCSEMWTSETMQPNKTFAEDLQLFDTSTQNNIKKSRFAEIREKSVKYAFLERRLECRQKLDSSTVASDSATGAINDDDDDDDEYTWVMSCHHQS